VLLVPNAALRFTPASAAPPGAQLSSGGASGGSMISKLMPAPPRLTRSGGGGNGAAPGERQVWVPVDGGAPRRVPVQVGLSDGKLTEVVGGELREGMAVIVEQQAARP